MTSNPRLAVPDTDSPCQTPTPRLIEPSAPSTPIIVASNITYDAQGEVTGYTAGAIEFAARFDLAGQATERTYAGATGHAFDWQVASRDGEVDPVFRTTPSFAFSADLNLGVVDEEAESEAV